MIIRMLEGSLYVHSYHSHDRNCIVNSWCYNLGSFKGISLKFIRATILEITVSMVTSM